MEGNCSRLLGTLMQYRWTLQTELTPRAGRLWRHAVRYGLLHHQRCCHPARLHGVSDKLSFTYQHLTSSGDLDSTKLKTKAKSLLLTFKPISSPLSKPDASSVPSSQLHSPIGLVGRRVCLELPSWLWQVFSCSSIPGEIYLAFMLEGEL